MYRASSLTSAQLGLPTTLCFVYSKLYRMLGLLNLKKYVRKLGKHTATYDYDNYQERHKQWCWDSLVHLWCYKYIFCITCICAARSTAWNYCCDKKTACMGRAWAVMCFYWLFNFPNPAWNFWIGKPSCYKVTAKCAITSREQ